MHAIDYSRALGAWATIAGLFAVLALALAAFPLAGEADGATRHFDPVKRPNRGAVFAPRHGDPGAVRGARAVIHHRKRGRLERRVPAWRVREALAKRRSVRVWVPRRAGRVRLHVKVRRNGDKDPAGDAPTPPPEGLLAVDDCSVPNVASIWGKLVAQDGSRHIWHPTGGPGGGPYREYVVFDGDNALGSYGERTEAGANDSGSGGANTFALYREGEHRVTEFWVRLPDRSMVDAQHYAIFMQQKQTQPNPDGGGSPVMSLVVSRGAFRMRMTNEPGGSENSELWSTPAQTGVWIRGFTDVVYSSDPAKGRIQVGIGDAVSPVFTRHTLKRDRTGASIPGHLRLGIYRDDAIDNTSRIELGPVRVYSG